MKLKTLALCPCMGIMLLAHAYAQSPVIKAERANNILCPGTGAAIRANLIDAAYPAIPNDHNIKHYTYQWYMNGAALDQSNQSVFTAQQAGDYQVGVTTYSQVLQANGNWGWSAQPDNTELSNSLTMTAAQTEPLTADFTVNGTSFIQLQPQNFFNCAMLMLAPATAAARMFRIDVTDPDHADATIYSTGNVFSALPDQLDLRSLCDVATMQNDGQAQGAQPVAAGNCNVFADQALPGRYAVHMTLSSGCPDFNLATTIGVIDVSPGPTPPTVAFKTTTTMTGNKDRMYYPLSNSSAAPDKVGRYSTVFDFSGCGYGKYAAICSYDLDLYQWDAVTSTWSSAAVWTKHVPATCNYKALLQQPLSAIGGNGFFESQENAPANSIWKIVVTYHNDCGSYTLSEVFQINDASFQ